MENETDEKREPEHNTADKKVMKPYFWVILGVCVLAAVILVIVLTQNKTGSDTNLDTSKSVETTFVPTDKPTEAPTEKPTEAPTEKPTEAPTEKPTEVLMEKPTEKPTKAPSASPATTESKDPGNEPDTDDPSKDVQDEKGSEDGGEPGSLSGLPEAGTYILLSKTSKQAALNLPKETASLMKDQALEYYKKAGSFKGLVMQEDGTGICYEDKEYAPFMIEEGYFYTPKYGTVFASYRTIFTYGVKDREKNWCVCYRLSPEEAASLPEPIQQEYQCTDFSKIRVDTLDQYRAIDSIYKRVESEGGNIREYFDEAYNAVLKIATKEAAERLEAEEKRKAIEEANKDISVGGRMTFGEKQVTMARVMELNGGPVPVDIDKGKVTFIGGTCTDKPIENMDDAYGVLESVINLLGGDENTEYECFSIKKDFRGYFYYTFLQMHDLKTVPGGVAKIIVDPNNKMRAVTSTLIGGEYAGPSEIKAMDSIELKEIVLKQKLFPEEELLFYEEFTKKTLFSVVLDPGVDSDPEENPELLKMRFVWVVYTSNPGIGSSEGERYPYLAHYISQEGEYLYNLPVMEIGDEAARTGYPTAYVFSDMEDEEWTGTVKYYDGHEETITVPVMRDPENGKYYLGDKTRRIALADCYEFLYNGYNVDMVSSETNDDWDNYFLITYKNMITVWDCYAALGWRGTEGTGNPILMLMDYCDKDHKPQDNAFYLGNVHGWEAFGFAATNSYGMALDAVAHEFTHGFSISSMTFVFYQNEYGAINEALSDIMGNICESVIEPGDTDPDWLIAEDSGSVLRNMSDPHKYDQPEYVWDRGYLQNVKKVTDINDKGGVHSNASLLSSLAYRLCSESSMPLDEAYRYWNYCIYSIVPGTDFKQLSILLPWLMDEAGLSQYTDDLKKYIKEARLLDKSIPEELEEGTSMIVLELPDEEVFKDGCWLLYVYEPDMEYNPDYVFEKDTSSGEESSQSDTEAPEPITVVPSVISMGAIGEDGRTIRLILPDSLPKTITLYHINKDTMKSDCLFLYINESWVKNSDTSVQYIVIPDGYYVLSSEGLEGISIE